MEVLEVGAAVRGKDAADAVGIRGISGIVGSSAGSGDIMRGPR